MKPREQWRPILEAEVRKWSSKSAAQLLSELSEVILNALVDEHSMSDGAAGPRFLLVKKREPKKADGDDQLSGEGQ